MDLIMDNGGNFFLPVAAEWPTSGADNDYD